MQTQNLTVFDGPNIYSKHAVVRLSIANADTSPVAVPALLETVDDLKLMQSFSDTAAQQAAKRIGDKTALSFGEAVGVLGVVFQDDRFEDALTYSSSGAEPSVEICVETNEPGLGGLSILFAEKVVQYQRTPKKTEAARSALLESAQLFMHQRANNRMAENMRLLVEVAGRRAIPYRLPLRANQPVTFGYGRYRNRLYETLADSTSAIGARMISRDKHLTSTLLASMGLPVPVQVQVYDNASLEEAIAKVGFPMVVKGRTGDKGSTVTANIRTRDALDYAIRKVPAEHRPVIIERFIEGTDYRLFVVGGRLVAAARRIPAHVVGDGTSSIRDLVRRENSRRRARPRGYWPVPLRIDRDSSETLSEQGLNPDAVPDKDQFVRLRRSDNLSTGGLSTDVTDEVHPDVADAAERAAVYVGLEIAGVDIMTTDITKPLHETKGGILEVNQFPGMRPHYITETPRDIAGLVMTHLFQDKNWGRIPILAMTGAAPRPGLAAILVRILEQAGLTLGTADAQRVSVAGRPIGDARAPASCKTVLQDPRVKACVFDCRPETIKAKGLDFSYCSVGIIPSATGPALAAASVLAGIASKALVLKAGEPEAAALARTFNGTLWRVGQETETGPEKTEGPAVVITGRDNENRLVLRRNGTEETILLVGEIAASGGPPETLAEDAAFAAAAALAEGHPLTAVRAGLRAQTGNGGSGA